VEKNYSDLFEEFDRATTAADTARQALSAFLPSPPDGDETPALTENFDLAYQELILAEEAEKEARGQLLARLRPDPA
jgi:hypothetical protein